MELRRPSRGTLRVLALALVVKLLVLGLGVAAFEALGDVRISRLADAFGIWVRWDALHYLWLAEHGYASEGEPRFLIAFPPLLPLLIRVVGAPFGAYVGAGFVVATLASLAAVVLLRALARLDAGEAEAQRAAFFLLVFPTSYVLHIPYTEGLFLALTLGAFLAARRGWWLAAGSLGALVALTRVTGVLLLPALALEAWDEWRRTRRLRAAWLALGLVALGFGAYLALNQAVLGSPFAFLQAQHEHWYRSSAWPWTGLAGLWEARAQRGANEAQILGTQELVFSLLALVASVAVARTQRASHAFWMGAHWLVFVGQSFVYSVPRLCLTLFPIFLLFGRLSRRPLWAAALTVWSLLYLALFVGLFVRGRWAF